MIKLLILGIFCAVLSGCTSPRYSEHAEAKFSEAKARVNQLRTGMTRTQVEAILNPMPQESASDWDNTGYLPVNYRLYPGIWITVEYLAPRNLLLRLPSYLDVGLSRNDKPNRDFTRIPLDQIK